VGWFGQDTVPKSVPVTPLPLSGCGCDSAIGEVHRTCRAASQLI